MAGLNKVTKKDVEMVQKSSATTGEDPRKGVAKAINATVDTLKKIGLAGKEAVHNVANYFTAKNEKLMQQAKQNRGMSVSEPEKTEPKPSERRNTR